MFQRSTVSMLTPGYFQLPSALVYMYGNLGTV
jgi:hypothetical protein